MELEQNFNKHNKFKKLPCKYFLIIFLYIISLFILKDNQYYRSNAFNKNIKSNKNNNLFYLNKYYIYKYLNNDEYLNVTNIKFFVSFRYRLIKVEYIIGFYDKNNNLIIPSDLALYNNLHIICAMMINEQYTINSLSFFYNNKYFKCIEFINFNEKIKFGIKIKEKFQYSTIYFFNETTLKFYNLIYQDNNIFDPLLINKKYNSLINKLQSNNLNKNLKLKELYLQYPYCTKKTDSILFDNKWIFKNFYNEYFCFCKGKKCLNIEITNSCKFPFYLYVIDNNKNIYSKTDYLFFDFIFAGLSSDDVYPVFEKMFKLSFPVHYITEKEDIHYLYCNNIKNCLTILPVKKELNPINGDFLEKYLTLFLKLKIVVSGRGTTFNTNLFYNII